MRQGPHEIMRVAVGWLRKHESIKQRQRSFALHQPPSSSTTLFIAYPTYPIPPANILSASTLPLETIQGPRATLHMRMACPPGSELVYSPFRPFSQSEYFAYTQRTDNACWWWVICLLEAADEARKQQFAAISLVMGFVPLTLKDIAWPERRVVSVSDDLPKPIDVIVRALGLVPSISPSSLAKKQLNSATTLYEWTKRLSSKAFMLLVAISVFGLLLAYGVLAIIEVFSKRSSLGCPYPISILTWHLFAIIPAGIETAFRRTPKNKHVPEVIFRPTAEATTFSVRPGDIEQYEQLVPVAVSEPSRSPNTAQSAEATTAIKSRDLTAARTERPDSALAVQQRQGISLDDTSPVQGIGNLWLVQFMWAIYYVAGTLVYTSIMAVTVIELFVWVMTSVAVTAASKLLAFFLCMAVERRRPSKLIMSQEKILDPIVDEVAVDVGGTP